MKIAIFLAAVTIGLFFAIGMVSAHYGPRVGERSPQVGSNSS